MIAQLFLFALTISCTSVFTETRANLLNILAIYTERTISLGEVTPFYMKLISLHLLAVLLMTAAAFSLAFYGIRAPKYPVSFYMGLVFYSLFSGLNLQFGENESANTVISASRYAVGTVALIIAIFFVIFYVLVRPFFLGVVVYLIFDSVATALFPNGGLLLSIILLICIIIPVRFLFDKFAWTFKFVLIGCFALYGSLFSLLCTSIYLRLPPTASFTAYISALNSKEESSTTYYALYTFLWLIAACGCGAFQLTLVKNGDKEELESDNSAESAKEAAKEK